MGSLPLIPPGKPIHFINDEMDGRKEGTAGPAQRKIDGQGKLGGKEKNGAGALAIVGSTQQRVMKQEIFQSYAQHWQTILSAQEKCEN